MLWLWQVTLKERQRKIRKCEREKMVVVGGDWTSSEVCPPHFNMCAYILSTSTCSSSRMSYGDQAPILFLLSRITVLLIYGGYIFLSQAYSRYISFYIRGNSAACTRFAVKSGRGSNGGEGARKGSKWVGKVEWSTWSGVMHTICYSTLLYYSTLR
ncbi:hypothetical protein DFH27DRAFT_272388 [Peziza echinospora]|nr:hypothetical protein DFH27DRAFT_272388 [Peziza echinospora]